MDESIAYRLIELRRLLECSLGCLKMNSPDLARDYTAKSIKMLDTILQAESHRIYLGQKPTECNACVFLISIIGREETRPGCVVSITEYSSLQKKVPETILAIELLRRVGKEGFQEIINRGATPDAFACGLFRPKLARV